jgi:DNA gyrase inhibitor GyrI
MGVGKYTPNYAVAGAMGWTPLYVKQWTNIFSHWSRCTKMEMESKFFNKFLLFFFFNKFLRRMQSYVTIEDFDVTGENCEL